MKQRLITLFLICALFISCQTVIDVKGMGSPENASSLQTNMTITSIDGNTDFIDLMVRGKGKQVIAKEYYDAVIKDSSNPIYRLNAGTHTLVIDYLSPYTRYYNNMPFRPRLATFKLIYEFEANKTYVIYSDFVPIGDSGKVTKIWIEEQKTK